MANPLVYIVEDDAVIAELLAFNLESGGYDTCSFREGQSMFSSLDKAASRIPDLFLLDLMLPGMDGFEICRRIRQNDRYQWIPIMMLTARSTENDKVKGLEHGADDYLTKPFGMRELLARIQALLRRYHKTRSQMTEHPESEAVSAEWPGPAPLAGDPAYQAGSAYPGRIVCGGIMIDDARHRVYKSGQEIEMTNREYELLKFLMIHQGVAYSRDDLLNYVWGYEYSGETRTVDVHIRQLRRKLEDDDANPVMIETVRGRGYRFTDQIG
ncbi:MAG: response regulator transcription factor [Clostridiaceae bacterium]|nr:response regulator transcription factor [Clostridiaceae bacterium]